MTTQLVVLALDPKQANGPAADVAWPRNAGLGPRPRPHRNAAALPARAQGRAPSFTARKRPRCERALVLGLAPAWVLVLALGACSAPRGQSPSIAAASAQGSPEERRSRPSPPTVQAAAAQTIPEEPPSATAAQDDPDAGHGLVQDRPEASEPAQPIPPSSGDAEAGGQAEQPPRPLRIPHEEYARAGRPIEDEAGAMSHFYGQLAAVLRGTRATLARVSVYSDSLNGTDQITSALRRAFQQRFGDGGKGFVPIAPGWPTQRHQDVLWSRSRSWRTLIVNRRQSPNGRYGLGGVLAESRGPGSRATFATVPDGPSGRAVSSYRLFFQAFPRGGEVSLQVDQESPTRLSTEADEIQDRVHELTVPEAAHSLELRVTRGTARLYGLVMERSGPGVVVDGLMLIGARTARLLNFEAGHWQGQLALRQPDLVVFWLGANDAIGESFSRSHFIRSYTEAISQARRGRPEASCLVVSTPDIGELPGGQTRRRMARLLSAQREVATATGCAFFDLFEAFGGRGTARRWFQADPRLMSGDYTHLTAAGASHVGRRLYETLLAGLDAFLVQEADFRNPSGS